MLPSAEVVLRGEVVLLLLLVLVEGVAQWGDSQVEGDLGRVCGINKEDLPQV